MQFIPGIRPHPPFSTGVAALHSSLFFSFVSGRTGDVRSFNELLSKWERVFIGKGTYLLMEKCLMLVYRNLVKKM